MGFDEIVVRSMTNRVMGNALFDLVQRPCSSDFAGRLFDLVQNFDRTLFVTLFGPCLDLAQRLFPLRFYFVRFGLGSNTGYL